MPASTEAWDEAARRATAAVAENEPGGMDEFCWDVVAARDITALVVYSLHVRGGVPVKAVRWPDVLWHLWDDRRVAALVEEVLPAAGHDLADGEDRVGERWRWLTRTWDPDAPIGPRPGVPPRTPLEELLLLARARSSEPAPEPRWGGMKRGVAPGLPDPAVEVCTGWAASAVEAAIVREQARGRYDRFDRVKVTGGPFKGERGYVMVRAWVLDDTVQSAHGPVGFEVSLDNAEGEQQIEPRHLRPASDRRWPGRPKGSPKAELPALDVEPRPTPTPAEHLLTLLAKAVNPEAVPTQLRDAVASAAYHGGVLENHQASAVPRRTWKIVRHSYRTNPFAGDEVAVLWEVRVTTHLHDPAPTTHLAIDEDGVSAIVSATTGGT
ncbi:hypothetical protein [Kitasatospora sp. HPMI-4]|uniref:hypothetical protein n=1 Tax=Kitasatospora sp. HPMI-4 TaxID=3448443 RepID=UPI003F1A8EAE